MKKVLAIILITAMAIAMLPSISAPILVQIIEQEPGAPIVTNYCIPDYYSIGTFSLTHSQTASFTIPATACPSLKKGPLWGIRAFGLPLGQLTDIGNAAPVIDTMQYQYNCYYKKPCDCIIPGDNQIVTNDVQVELCFPRELQICVSGSVNTPSLIILAYDNEGGPIIFILYSWYQVGPDDWCVYIPEIGTPIGRIEIINSGDTINGEISILECCCYDCYKQKALPTTLYPKIDIETFSVPGGATVIKDGKVISKFEITPGSQQVFLQVENRGFFTQSDTRLRFDGLPEGVTVEVTPETQKIKAHNIASYSANFTVGANVPSGTYQITMVSYSPNGMFDKITFEFVVQ